MTRFQEFSRKCMQVGDEVIFFVCPEERLLKTQRLIISIILGVDAITDNKDLGKQVKATAHPKGIAVITVNLMKGFFQF